MTDQRELDRILGKFLADGADGVADRVIDAALDQIDHTPQRRVMRMPRRFQTMPTITRLAAAAVIGVLAVGGAFYLIKPSQATIGGPSPTPSATAGPTPTVKPSPSPTLPAPSALAGPLGDGRQVHTATALADGRVLVAGGTGTSDRALDSALLYDPGTNKFSPTGVLTTARGEHTATLLSSGLVLITGGGPASWVTGAGSFLASAELYDPKTGTFTNTGSMSTPRTGHTATRLSDGRVLITGGNDIAGRAVATAELYDPATGTFSPTGSMSTVRGFHTATLLTDGRVLIAGGDTAAWDDNGPYLATAELYDPKTGKFTATGSMAVGRALHAATLLSSGRVLVTGGVSDSGNFSLASAEVYDPATGSFTAAGPMTVGRVFQSATLLPDGRVLVAGGLAHGRVYASNPQFLASAELFDPKAGTFSATASMADMRAFHAATLLGDGRVLITGGAVDSGVYRLASAEIYDPKSGAFVPAG